MGLEQNGHDFVNIVPELHLPPELAIRFIFPHAPVMPVTLNGGMKIRAWFDLVALSDKGPIDHKGVTSSAAMVDQLIAYEKKRGIPSDKNNFSRVFSGRLDGATLWFAL